MNKEKMLEIADLIEKSDPRNFSMTSWFGKRRLFSELLEQEAEDYTELEEFFNEEDEVVVSYRPTFLAIEQEFDKTTLVGSCNTTACIAGWVMLNEWSKSSTEDRHSDLSSASAYALDFAREVLGLSYRQANRLFYCEEDSVWYQYKNEYGFSFYPGVPETWDLDNKKVADVIRRIVDGSIVLEDTDEEEEI